MPCRRLSREGVRAISRCLVAPGGAIGGGGGAVALWPEDWVRPMDVAGKRCVLFCWFWFVDIAVRGVGRQWGSRGCGSGKANNWQWVQAMMWGEAVSGRIDDLGLGFTLTAIMNLVDLTAPLRRPKPFYQGRNGFVETPPDPDDLGEFALDRHRLAVFILTQKDRPIPRYAEPFFFFVCWHLRITMMYHTFYHS